MEINPQLITINLIPGQGSDRRIFSELNFEGNHEINHLTYLIPHKAESLGAYSKRMAAQIDPSKKNIIIGVSLGGMIATEMHEIVKPEKTIIISSAKSYQELPIQYRLQRLIPFYRILSNNLAQKAALFVQPIVEPDRNKRKELFISMLSDKNPVFLNRAIGMIINWQREKYPDNIIHIHGDNDKTIPIKNVKYDYLIENGSHMMTLTRAEELNDILDQIIHN